MPKWSKGEVCKTSIRGFESRPRLQLSPLESLEYGLSRLLHLTQLGNSWEQLALQILHRSQGELLRGGFRRVLKRN